MSEARNAALTSPKYSGSCSPRLVFCQAKSVLLRDGGSTLCQVEEGSVNTHANKLSRTYAMLLEALNRHRGKGQQKVTVEHVHVHAGGQAIVGNISAPGGSAKLEDQPHAQGKSSTLPVADASVPSVRGKD